MTRRKQKEKEKDKTKRGKKRKKGQHRVSVSPLGLHTKSRKCHSGEEPMHIIIIKASNEPKNKNIEIYNIY